MAQIAFESGNVDGLLQTLKHIKDLAAKKAKEVIHYTAKKTTQAAHAAQAFGKSVKDNYKQLRDAHEKNISDNNDASETTETSGDDPSEDLIFYIKSISVVVEMLQEVLSKMGQATPADPSTGNTMDWRRYNEQLSSGWTQARVSNLGRMPIQPYWPGD